MVARRAARLTGGARRLSFVFLQGDPGCRVGGYGTGNGWPARTAAHELAARAERLLRARHRAERVRRPRACVRQQRRHPVDGHVASVVRNCSTPSSTSVTTTTTTTPAAGGTSATRAWLVHLESPRRACSRSPSRAPAARSSSIPDGSVCADTRARSATTVAPPVRLSRGRTRWLSTARCGVAHVPGSSETCDTTV